MDLYQHFRPEEHDFVDQILEWRNYVTTQYAPKLTDFLDPRQQKIAQMVIGKDDEVKVELWGGNQTVERKRLLMFPSYFEPNEDDYGLTAFQVQYPAKFITLNHQDMLGALMSLGLKREKFGDILKKDDVIQIIVASEIADFIRLHLTSVGKANITLTPIELDKLFELEEQWITKTGTVSSLRLDVILSEIFNLSRSKVIPYIQNKKVKLNWKVIDQPSTEVKEGDHLSFKGLGRAKLIAIEGMTKRNKYRIQYGTKK